MYFVIGRAAAQTIARGVRRAAAAHEHVMGVVALVSVYVIARAMTDRDAIGVPETHEIIHTIPKIKSAQLS